MTLDLQNTFALPKAYVGHYYYKQKLNCYNLTAHSSTDNTIYNAIWHEYICGRAGNHLANVVIKILKAVVKDNLDVTKIILWTDSCVPQNRNSILSFALQHFLKTENAGKVESITQKFSEPGHGNLQEIDSAHSCIERHLRHLEIWSPLTLIRTLLTIPIWWKKKFKVLQMRADDFLDYGSAASALNYQILPYTKAKIIEYNKTEVTNLKYGESFDGMLKEVKIVPKTEQAQKTRGQKKQVPNVINWEVKVAKDVNLGISEEKRKAITEMLPQMPETEREFYLTILSKAKPPLTKKSNKSVTGTSSKQITNNSSQHSLDLNVTEDSQSKGKKRQYKKTLITCSPNQITNNVSQPILDESITKKLQSKRDNRQDIQHTVNRGISNSKSQCKMKTRSQNS